MKKLFIKVLISVLALSAGIAVVKYFSPEKSLKPSFITNNNTKDPNAVPFSKQKEDSETFRLDSYKPIVISKINGSIEIEYADVTVTEVKVIRFATEQEDFDYRQLIIDESRRKLDIRIRKSSSLWSLLGMIPEERQNVIIKAPRGTRVITKCINGYVEERETHEGKTETRRNDYQCSQ